MNNDNEINKKISKKLEKVVAFSQHFDHHICILSVLFINHTTCVIEYSHQRNFEKEKRKMFLSWA